MALRALAHGVPGARRGAVRRGRARRASRFIRGHLLRDEGRLWRTARDGRRTRRPSARTTPHVADGLLAAYAALGEPADLELAVALMDRAVADFWDEASGTFFDTSDEHDRVVARPRSLIDGATPAANSVAADVLLRLALLTGEPDHDRRARSILRAAGAAPWIGTRSSSGRMLAAADRAARRADRRRHRRRRVTTSGAVALRRAAAGPYQPDLVIAPLSPTTASRPGRSSRERRRATGAPTAYVCRGYACDEPTIDPARVMAQVAGLA